jgi:hypothetical protein
VALATPRFNHSLGRERNMADTEQRRQPDTDEQNALRARVDYAESLVDWVNQAPQPPQPQTAAKTFNEALGEIVGELARIRACYDIKGAQEWLNEHDPDVIYNPPSGLPRLVGGAKQEG